ncbi:uncharacterized protein LOC127249741 [Andrographis paniculata]|uniref:uncharacterized protein LOC127249741 n=1 Tax=Andrographis paniculata TaxID=175694 RepID=UPI0021E769ED|nr:uncharacterized protein LOC127249741 [Andrographis paniculata]
MAAYVNVMPNLSPPTLPLHPKDYSNNRPSSSIPLLLLPLSSSSTAAATTTTTTIRSAAQVTTPPPTHQHHQDDDQRNQFYLNLGLAVRTLRQDLPLLFTKDLNYNIYRDDITFSDPLNSFTGIDKYKLIFWALRFHGRILFRDISFDVLRVWQPSENMILIRWNLRGVPRVPWEAKGEFQGTSRYKLDRNGKIYEHKVDNFAFNFPHTLRPATSVLDLVAASCPASPNPTFMWEHDHEHGWYSCSWVEFYRAVKETVDRQGLALPQDCFAACL